jgi:uncharacterized protein YjbK
MSDLEVELKLTIDARGYRTVLAGFKDSIADDIDQWDIFLDTPDHKLEHSQRNIRLRSAASLRHPTKWRLTVKAVGTARDGIWSRREVEEEITDDAARTIIFSPSLLYWNSPPRIQKEIETFKDDEIIVIGDFRTFRRVIAFNELHLECDETVFPNHTSLFEIECEHSDCDLAKQKIEAKLKELGVEFVPSPTGKLERLMELPEAGRHSRKFGLQ